MLLHLDAAALFRVPGAIGQEEELAVSGTVHSQ